MKRIISTVFVLSVLLNSTVLFADSTWVSGTIVGETWTVAGSPYCVVGDIRVAGTGLVIQAGVDVIFHGDFVFEVAGVLTAIGTEQDSIVFTKADTISGWQGIFFNYSTPGSELAYCTIEASINSGISIDNSTPTIRNCTFENNSGTYGGGIRADFLIIENCKFINNFASDSGSSSGSSSGGGVYVNGDASIARCEFTGNRASAYSSGLYARSYATGGGIYVNGTLAISNCFISENSSYANASGSFAVSDSRGGGIYLGGTSSLNNCIISFNSSTEDHSGGLSQGISGGSGICVDPGPAVLTNCTIARNTNEGLRNEGDTVIVINSILWENTPSQISGTATVTYSDVQDGWEGEGNINLNPSFESPTNLIILDGSPCMDAGNPDPAYNDSCFPPSLGTDRNDMGAHGGPLACGWPNGITEAQLSAPLSKEYALSQNYPNPFNPITQIRYTLPRDCEVELTIYNILGQKVTTLVDGKQKAGYKTVRWDAGSFSSGIYFCRLTAGDFVDTRKMVLLK